MTVGTTWVFAEAAGDGVAPSTLELLTKAGALGGTVEAFHAGDGAERLAGELGRFGAATVRTTGTLGDGLVGVAAAAAMAAEIERGNRPDLILAAMSYDGRDLLGRLSARLDRPVISDGVDLRVSDGAVVVDKAVFGGAAVVTTAFRAEPPYLAGIRPKSFAAAPAAAPTEPEVVTVEVPDLGRAGAAAVTGRHVEEQTGPRLDDAAVVVAGGRGLGNPDAFRLVEELAGLLRGAPGATRAIVDAGWVPYAYQIGQTGKTVKPDLYVALGISGATQHLAGMNGAKRIIAVNSDADAPIFSLADLGIVGDVHKVVPKLIEALKSRG
jgi:electron transfer flavoprotein alpha subunit